MSSLWTNASEMAEAYQGSEGRVVGPELPTAFCKCGHRLTFEQVRYGRLGWGWRCHCEGCVDGEYVGDPLQLRMTVVSGEGQSPWEALDDLAAMHFDLFPEDLLTEGWK